MATRVDRTGIKERKDFRNYRVIGGETFLAALLLVCFLWFSSCSIARSASIGGRTDKWDWEQGRKDLQEHRSIVGKTFLAALPFLSVFRGSLVVR